jgi:hypothetical protein
MAMSKADETRLPCSFEVRDLVRDQKRRGENYDTLLRKMVAQYDPQRGND